MNWKETIYKPTSMFILKFAPSKQAILHASLFLLGFRDLLTSPVSLSTSSRSIFCPESLKNLANFTNQVNIQLDTSTKRSVKASLS